jgi:hypothetical protein
MDNTTADIAKAPLPTASTLHRRQNLLFQAWRFVALNLRFLTMITKGDH